MMYDDGVGWWWWWWWGGAQLTHSENWDNMGCVCAQLTHSENWDSMGVGVGGGGA